MWIIESNPSSFIGGSYFAKKEWIATAGTYRHSSPKPHVRNAFRWNANSFVLSKTTARIGTPNCDASLTHIWRVYIFRSTHLIKFIRSIRMKDSDYVSNTSICSFHAYLIYRTFTDPFVLSMTTDFPSSNILDAIFSHFRIVPNVSWFIRTWLRK